jgi:hypothetical protein
MAMDPATISAVSALAGSGIGALASVTTTWLTQHFQGQAQRLKQEASRRERLFSVFVDQASQTYADGLVHDGLDDPATLVPLYATINKLRLFATRNTVRAAETVLDGIVANYEAPQAGLNRRGTSVSAHDILRAFADSCRAELESLR